ncbi:MAG: K(+)-transporting ATPase subunit C [Chloroflexota bacterium]
MARQVRISVIMMLALTLLLGLAYPLLTTVLAQVLFPAQANGSLVQGADGTMIGSRLIGQNFADPSYFHPRPSAAGQDGYDAGTSSGSNLGPTSRKLLDAVAERTQAYRQLNNLGVDVPVPVDAVTSSASGLDPDISPANAQLQAPRVARERNLPEEQVKALVTQHVQGRTLGILGEPRVNVLDLNQALDRISAP